MYKSDVEEGGNFPVVGTPENPFIENVEITRIEFSDDGRLEMDFTQPNGGVVKHTEFGASDAFGNVEEQEARISRRLKHIATKIIPEDKYVIPECESWDEFAQTWVDLIGDAYKGKKFRMLFIYGSKGYVNLPMFAPFIEPMEVSPTKLTLSEYNRARLTRPEQAKPDVDPEISDDIVPEPDDKDPF